MCHTMQVLLRLTTTNSRAPTHISVHWTKGDDSCEPAGKVQEERGPQDSVGNGTTNGLIPAAAIAIPDSLSPESVTPSEAVAPIAYEVRHLHGTSFQCSMNRHVTIISVQHSHDCLQRHDGVISTILHKYLRIAELKLRLERFLLYRPPPHRTGISVTVSPAIPADRYPRAPQRYVMNTEVLICYSTFFVEHQRYLRGTHIWPCGPACYSSPRLGTYYHHGFTEPCFRNTRNSPPFMLPLDTMITPELLLLHLELA